MISMYSAREQAASRFNHSPEAEAYRRAHRLAVLRATLLAQGCTAESPARSTLTPSGSPARTGSHDPLRRRARRHDRDPRPLARPW